MATLTVQSIVLAGLTPSYVAAAGGGDEFADNLDQRTFFICKNGGGSPITITITQEISVILEAGIGTITLTAPAIVVTNGTEEWIGPFPDQRFADATTGRVAVTYSAVTSVTVAAIELIST